MSPRISHSTFTELFLYCLVLRSIVFRTFIFITSDWATTDVGDVLFVPSFALSCSYWSKHFVDVITSWLVCCPVRVPRTMYLYLIEFAWDTFDSEIVILTCDSQSGEHVWSVLHFYRGTSSLGRQYGTWNRCPIGIDASGCQPRPQHNTLSWSHYDVGFSKSNDSITRLCQYRNRSYFRLINW